MDLPATPVGQKTEWVFDRFGSRPSEEDLKQAFAPAFLERVPPLRLKAFFFMLRTLRGAEIASMNEVGPHELELVLGARSREHQMRIRVNGEAPHLIEGLLVRPRGSSWPEILENTKGQRSLTRAIRKHLRAVARHLPAGGVAAGVIRGDSVAQETFGVAVDDDIFEIGSITKPITGILTAVAVERGELRYDSTLGDLIGVQGSASPVTVEQLATHTSGLPRLPGGFAPANEKDPYADFTVDDLKQAVDQVQLETPPGQTSSYSNLGFGLLGHVLSVTGQAPYPQLLADRFCEPLGLTSTFVEFPEHVESRLVPGHSGKESVPWWKPGAILGAGGIGSSLEDMLAICRANIQTEGPLAGALLDAHRPRASTEDGAQVGLGWRVMDAGDGTHVHWHNGGTGGFRSFLGFHRPTRTGVVVLLNNTFDPDEAALTLLASLMKSA